MILDGSIFYQAYDMTRTIGMLFAFFLTVVVETAIIYYGSKKWKLYECPSILYTIVLLANFVTFLLGMVMFTWGI